MTFIFTRCPDAGSLPLVVRSVFSRIQREIERNASLAGVRLLSVTLNPVFDTPQVLSAYASAKEADRHDGNS